MRKKNLLLNLYSFPTLKIYKRVEKVIKFIITKLYGEKLKEVNKPKIKDIKENT